MPIKIECKIFSVKFHEGKNGNYAIAQLMNEKNKSIIELYIKDIGKASQLQTYEDEYAVLEIELIPFKNSYFLGKIISCEALAA